jgi:nucleoside-diphosphate-sugar epimerase
VRVLVVGGTGFIGPPVVRCLHDGGHEVTVFHRGQAEPDLPAGVHHVHGERADLARFRGEFARIGPDVALFQSCYEQRDAEAARDAVTGLVGRIVAVSSRDVYRAHDVLRGRAGGIEPNPIPEDAPLRDSLYPYGDDYEKILVERVVLGDRSTPGTVLRLPAVYGPGDAQHRLFAYLKQMDDARPAILLEEAVASWRSSRVFVENAAAAVASAVVDERAAGRVYNVGEEPALSEAGWVREIGRVAGWGGDVVAVPRDLAPAHVVPDTNPAQGMVLDTARIRAELGYAERASRGDALRRTVAWEREHPPARRPSEQEWAERYRAEDVTLARLATRP